MSELAPFARAVELGGLVDRVVDVLQGGEEQQHERPRRREHGHHDEDAHGDARAGEPVPVADAEEEAVREAGRRVVDAEVLEDDVEEPVRVVEPCRAVQAEERQQLVDRARRIEEEEEEDGDRDGARDRREVEGGPEEADELDASIDERRRGRAPPPSGSERRRSRSRGCCGLRCRSCSGRGPAR